MIFSQQVFANYTSSSRILILASTKLFVATSFYSYNDTSPVVVELEVVFPAAGQSQATYMWTFQLSHQIPLTHLQLMLRPRSLCLAHRCISMRVGPLPPSYRPDFCRTDSIRSQHRSLCWIREQTAPLSTRLDLGPRLVFRHQLARQTRIDQ